MRFLHILLILLAGQIGTSAGAQAFSAQDVMSVCVTTPTDPAQIPAILLARGWIEPDADQAAALRPEVTVAYLAAQYWMADSPMGTSVGPEEWQEGWKRLNSTPNEINERQRIFLHPESGAILVFSNYSSKLVFNLDCLLAVPQSLLKKSSYFPKLRAPTAPALSFVVSEYLFSSTTRSAFYIQSASLDSEGISKVLNSPTTVGAAFHSSVKYPKGAVSP